MDEFHETQLGILEPVKEVTEWVNIFVIIEKNLPLDSSNTYALGHSIQKKLRICLDPRDLNEDFEREPYYTRSIEDILEKFYGMKRFTISDFNKGYWMVELHPDSRKIDDNGFGHWKVSGGQDFQWVPSLLRMFSKGNLTASSLTSTGVTGIADDMIIYGRDDQEHDGNEC